MKFGRVSMAFGLTLMAGMVLAQARFDDLVRGDFFAGFAGNKEALERGMKVTEQVLAANPQHAEAKVWHGTGLHFRAIEAFEKGDPQTGIPLWERSLKEMEEGVQLAPDSVAVLIPRGATLIVTSRFAPGDFGKPLLETGVSDFEKVLKIQERYFSTLSGHSRGELLTGLADGYSRLGRQEKAREFFERITIELKGSIYEERARAWLANKPEVKAPTFFACSGCHTR